MEYPFPVRVFGAIAGNVCSPVNSLSKWSKNLAHYAMFDKKCKGHKRRYDEKHSRKQQGLQNRFWSPRNL
jgi:hypothetical protein